MTDETHGPQGAETETSRVRGRVVRTTGSWQDVLVNGQVIPSRVRGKFRLAEQDVTNPVAVGDYVRIRLSDDGTGLITDIEPRGNKLSRRAAGRRAGVEHIIAANVDAGWVLQSIRMPRLNPGFIDRFLVMAERGGLTALVVLNKTDLAVKSSWKQEMKYWADLYTALGYDVYLISAKTGDGVDVLREALSGATTVVVGPSGVGKSTLLNALEPGLDVRTAEVSEKTSKGRHTTTFASMHTMTGGGALIDTPGIREFGIWDVGPYDLSHYFVEMRPHLDACYFANCTHDHEPQCGVKAAVERGEIREERYESYLNILASVQMGLGDVGR